jgi:hypothetical protein
VSKLVYTYPLFRDKQWLEDNYINSNLTIKDLAILAGCSNVTIHSWVSKYNLPKRDILTSNRCKQFFVDHPEYKNKGRRKYIDLELLKIEYIENECTIRFLCQKFDSDYSTIKKCLEELNIEIRPSSVYQIGSKRSPEFCANMSKYQKGRPHPWQVGDLNPSRRPEVQEKISKKTRGVKKPQTSGSKNGNWHGGISYEKYGIAFTPELREDIRKSFNQKCFICGKTKAENNNRLLPIHHIDYDKHNNSLYNLVPLCSSHHGGTNFDRKFWTNELQTMLFAYILRTILCLE